MTVDGAPIASGSGLRVDTFPLAADRDVLREFCDAWFNATVPPEIAVFKPAAPLVLCSLIHYPEMEDELVWKTGAQSQNELYFLVPIARYRVVAGKEKFVEYGITTPYIFVDNAASVVAGRERFGFPKRDCRFASGGASDRALPWVESEQRYVAMSTWEPTIHGEKLRELLRIVRLPTADRARTPLDVGAVLRGVRMAAQSASAGLESLRGANVEAVQRFSSSIRAGMRVSAYNLRQFADPEVESGASYQDLVRFEMRVREIHTAGFLGGAGDPFRLQLRRVEVTPIAKRLGLQFASGVRERDEFDSLDPIGPFYSRVDVDLLHAERVCWRKDTSGWRTDGGDPVGAPASGHPRYNDRLGPSAAAFLEHQPPEPTLDVKMTMLAARSAAVAAHLTSVLPVVPDLAIRPVDHDGWTAVRLLASRSRRPADAEAESLVWLDGSYLSLAVPVELTLAGERHRALLLLLDFTDNGFLLQAMRELALAPTNLASFDTSGSEWFAQTQPSRCLLRIHSLALQRSAAAAKLSMSPIVDVFAIQSDAAAPSIPELLCDSLWSSIDRSFPVLSFGTIPHVDPRRGLVSRRLLLSRYVDHGPHHSPASPREDLVVQFHDSESFPVFANLGFAELPIGSAIADSVRQPGSGRTRVVPGLRTVQFSATVRLRSMKVVWQDDGGA